MRKQFIILLLTALVSCSLFACKNDMAKENGEQYGDIKKGLKASSGVSQAEGLTSLIHQTGPFYRYCSTEDGFYYLTEKNAELADGNYGSHLMYMDYATEQEVYLCNDSSCQHNTQDCTSVFAGASEESRIFIWNGCLYFLDRAADTSGSMIVNRIGDSGMADAEALQAKLYRMNLDGSQRECIYTFETDITVEDVALGGLEGLYFITKKLGVSESSAGDYTTTSERQLICVNPDSGEAKSVCSFDFQDGLNWNVIGCAGEQAVLKAYQYAGGMTEEEAAALDEKRYLEALENSQIIYAVLNLSTGEKTQIYSQSAKDNSSSEAILDGCLYASNGISEKITKVDLTTGEESALCSLENNYLYGTLGNLLCCTSHDMTEDYGYYLVNTETGEVSYCGLTNETLGWRLDLLAVTGEYALVVYDYQCTALGDDSYEITRYQYGLIALTDLLHSEADYRPIHMLREGI